MHKPANKCKSAAAAAAVAWGLVAGPDTVTRRVSALARSTDETGEETSVDSEYLLTRVLTHEYLFFDTFWHSSLLEFVLSLLTILERVEY